MRADLERLFAVRDANLNEAGRGPAAAAAAPGPDAFTRKGNKP